MKHRIGTLAFVVLFPLFPAVISTHFMGARHFVSARPEHDRDQPGQGDIAIGALAAMPSIPPENHIQGDPADSLYQSAREALSRNDFRQAARLLSEIVERYPDSAHAPDALYWRAFSLYRLGGSDNLRQAIAALDEQGERFPDATTRGDAEALTVRIRGALANLGDAEAAERVTQRARQQSECPAEDDESDVRIAALNALLQMDSEQAMPILLQVLARRDGCSIGLRRKAVFLVAQQDAVETEDVLLATARDDPDPGVREQAVFWLSQVDTDRAVSALEDILSGSGDYALQEKALFALSQHESDRARLILQRFAENPDAPVDLRDKAIFWLGQEGSEESTEFLRTLYGRLDDATLKERVLFSISQTDDPAAIAWLLDVAMRQSEDKELRKKALFWAGQSDQPMTDLVELYSRLDDAELKEQLIFVYSQRDEPEAVDRLIDIARNEPDPELRKKAIFWLGQMDDPRVAEFLSEIINQ